MKDGVIILIQEEFNGPYEVLTNIPNFKLKFKTLNPSKELPETETFTFELKSK